MNTEEKKDNKVLMLGVAATAGLALGFIFGRKYEYRNGQFIWHGILYEAANNGQTSIFWDTKDGTKSLEFLVKFIEEKTN